MPGLIDKIRKVVGPRMQEVFHWSNPNMLPKIRRVVVNVGIRSDLKDPKVVEDYFRDLKAITGQMPVKTKAKKSISAFKIRQGQTVGLMVTLRGKRMYEFFDKLLSVTLARVRDFRGLSPEGFDRQGNYSIGLRDQIAFPEISSDSVSHLFGLQITVVVDARKPEEAREYLKLLGLPLKGK